MMKLLLKAKSFILVSLKRKQNTQWSDKQLEAFELRKEIMSPATFEIFSSIGFNKDILKNFEDLFFVLSTKARLYGAGDEYTQALEELLALISACAEITKK